MADRDQYRGYGSPSGRYYEGREYGPTSSDRSRRDRDERSAYGGDRDRDDWRHSRDDDDRGFFERAGDEIRSWFGDDDDRGRSYGDRDDYRRSRPERERGYGAGGMMSGPGGRERDFRQDAREPWGGGDRGDYGRRESGAYESAGSRYGPAYQDRPRDRFGGAYPHDEHYSEWRRQQLEALDRDYDEYRRENRDKFHSEFSNWRGQRQQQRASIRQVREDMEVVGSDGQPVGTVDKVSGDRIILTKSGAMAGGHHHSIPCSWIQSVDERVTINKSAEQARQQWTDEENRRALFESEDQRRDDGPHILGRSFSGTYER